MENTEKITKSKSAHLYLMVQDNRKSRRNQCQNCDTESARDRRYGFPKRYGMKTLVSTRRVDRIDPIRSLY